MTNEPADALSLLLLTAEAPAWEPDVVAGRLQDAGESTEVSLPADPSQLLVIRPAESELIVFSPARLDPASTQQALRQTWDWPQGGGEVARCKWSVLVADRRAKRLARQRRVSQLRQAVAALIDTCPGCLALHSLLCQHLIEPAAFLLGQRPGGDVLCGLVNVRLYNVTDHGPETRLMDTLGLAALGLPDLQCVFQGLKAEDVAGVLLDHAYFLFENGDVIADGQLLSGPQAGTHWVCGRQESLTEPRRIVLDLYPGPEHQPV